MPLSSDRLYLSFSWAEWVFISEASKPPVKFLNIKQKFRNQKCVFSTPWAVLSKTNNRTPNLQGSNLCHKSWKNGLFYTSTKKNEKGSGDFLNLNRPDWASHGMYPNQSLCYVFIHVWNDWFRINFASANYVIGLLNFQTWCGGGVDKIGQFIKFIPTEFLLLFVRI